MESSLLFRISHPMMCGGADAVGFRSFRPGTGNHAAAEDPVVSGAVPHADGETAAAVDGEIFERVPPAADRLDDVGEAPPDGDAVADAERGGSRKPDPHPAATRREDLRFPGEAPQIGAERSVRQEDFETLVRDQVRNQIRIPFLHLEFDGSAVRGNPGDLHLRENHRIEVERQIADGEVGAVLDLENVIFPTHQQCGAVAVDGDVLQAGDRGPAVGAVDLLFQLEMFHFAGEDRPDGFSPIRTGEQQRQKAGAGEKTADEMFHDVPQLFFATTRVSSRV